ncbi:MAG: hypothetical protein WCC57_12975 [Paracoccaceae bacterium]
MDTVLVLGSGPNVTAARSFPRLAFDHILAINNAWQVRPDWDAAIYPFDFPTDRRPTAGPGQTIVTQEAFVPAQNALGGFVYAGGTMAFTAAYWALHSHQPRVIAVLGCDMHYPTRGATHFYGIGSPDPLRADVTLQSLEAKSARLWIMAAMQGCAIINLSKGPSRLIFPRYDVSDLGGLRPAPFDTALAETALAQEASLGYYVPSGRYWDEITRFDPVALRDLDMLWLAAAQPAQRQIA